MTGSKGPFHFCRLVRSIALSWFLFHLTGLVYRYNLCSKAHAQGRGPVQNINMEIGKSLFLKTVHVEILSKQFLVT
jgi:hypothetical protein